MVHAVVLGVNRLMQEKERESYCEQFVAINPARESLSYRTHNNIAEAALAAMLIIVIWPIVVCMKAKDVLNSKNGTKAAVEWKFAVEPQHLLERLTLEDVEMREIVTDPLQAAPELPFGHLHAAWKEFLKGQAEGCELWSFSAHWQTIWGRNELRSGYVLVENGAPGAYFLTVLKDLPNDTESDGNV